MAQIQPEMDEQAATTLLEASGLAGSKWSFVYLAKSQGGQTAKDAFLAAVSTVGVIDALLLSFAVPSLASPPATLMDGEHEVSVRLWFWFTFMSVIMAIASVIIATIILTYSTAVPKEGIVDYLVTVHLPYSIMAASFMLAVLLQGGAQLATVNSYVDPTDFWAAVAVLLVVYCSIFLYFLSVDHQSGVKNKALYERWLKQQHEGGGQKGE